MSIPRPICSASPTNHRLVSFVVVAAVAASPVVAVFFVGAAAAVVGVVAAASAAVISFAVASGCCHCRHGQQDSMFILPSNFALKSELRHVVRSLRHSIR